MQRRNFVALVASVAAESCMPLQAKDGKTPTNNAHCAWASRIFQAMLTIRPGMTRRDLLRVFTEEGGLSMREQQTYVSRECALFHVDVTFRAAGDVRRDKDGRLLHNEDDRDVIITISVPYLAFEAMD